ncbi:MAG: hypothetical protein H0V93_10895 [Euzebyales bacterium]|nr:hypothetical protein [Euzebyales bacterium]
MAVDERERRGLHTALVGALGEEAADTLMAQLPAVPRDDLATKADLEALEQRMDARFEALEQRMDARFEAMEYRLLAAFRGELNAAVTSQTRTMIFTTTGAVVSLGGLALALARFA